LNVTYDELYYVSVQIKIQIFSQLLLRLNINFKEFRRRR